MTRRTLLLGSAAVCALNAPDASARFLRGGGASTAGGASLATHTFVNTSGSTVSAGAISPRFGHPFKKGDIPSGTAPIFKAGIDVQPYSWGGQVYWSDGSLKWASFRLRLAGAASIAGSGTLSIGVWSGGTAPAASSLTLTDFYNEAVAVSGTGLGANFGLSGTCGAWLSLANASNITASKSIVTLDGDAGKGMSFWIEMSATEGGAAHGALVCQIDMDILLNSGGSRAFHEVLFDVCQPYYEDSKHASGEASGTKVARAFSALGWSHNGGGTTQFPFPQAPKAFTSDGTNNIGTDTAYYFGSPDYNTVPCTVSGLTGTNLSTTQLYYFGCWFNGALFLGSSSNNAWDNAINVTAGSGTITPVRAVVPFGHLFGADTTGRYNFFQGSGSVTSRPTIRTKYDRSYWRSTGLIDYYDETFVPSDITFTYQTWQPYHIGPLKPLLGATGERADLGSYHTWAAWHHYNQSTTDEFIIRALGFAAGHYCNGLYDSTTKTVPNIRSGTYTGMPASTPSLWWDGTNVSGFTAPTSGYMMGLDLNSGGIQPTHRSALPYYSYLVLGEPHILRMALEWAVPGLLSFPPANRSTTTPTARSGIPVAFDAERAFAWAARDAFDCATLLPTSWTESQYIRDMVADICGRIAEINGNAPFNNAYHTAHGVWNLVFPDQTTIMQTGAWLRAYLRSALVKAAVALENADALTALNQDATFSLYKFNSLGGGYAVSTSYQEKVFENPTGGNQGTGAVTQDSHFGFSHPYKDNPLSWNTGSSSTLFTLASAYAAVPTPHNGDIVQFYDSGSTPPGFAAATPYYVVSLSGSGPWTFGLSATLGGSAITITSGSGTIDGWFSSQSWPAAGAANSFGPDDDTNPNALASFRRSKNLAGITGLGTLIADLAQRVVDRGLSYDSQWYLKYNMAA